MFRKKINIIMFFFVGFIWNGICYPGYQCKQQKRPNVPLNNKHRVNEFFQLYIENNQLLYHKKCNKNQIWNELVCKNVKFVMNGVDVDISEETRKSATFIRKYFVKYIDISKYYLMNYDEYKITYFEERYIYFTFYSILNLISSDIITLQFNRYGCINEIKLKTISNNVINWFLSIILIYCMPISILIFYIITFRARIQYYNAILMYIINIFLDRYLYILIQ